MTPGNCVAKSGRLLATRTLEEKTDLFCFYPRESAPQACFLKFDIRSGELTADYDPEIGVNHCTRAERDRLILTWPIPCLTKEAGNQLLQGNR